MLSPKTHPAINQTGLRANLGQFSLLMLINAMVGGMIGLERTILPILGSQTFGLSSTTTVLSFIISFGLVKALMNLIAGVLADRYGRKRILVLGWLVGLPVPWMLIYAPSWGWIVAANVLLGINQGLAWSMAVVMKIDLVGPQQRGFAVGLNEFTGYMAVAITAWLTGYLASSYGVRPVPFYLGIGYAIIGLGLSIGLVRETHGLVQQSTSTSSNFWQLVQQTSWGNRTLFGASQAGLINNLNDGMAWGILPLFFASYGLELPAIGLLKFIYPAVWSVGQLITGPLSDKLGRKALIVQGMLLQAAALGLIVNTTSFGWWLLSSIGLGIGTAMVYPTLIAVVSDNATPASRARVLGIYRFWRDLGYAIGALLAGIIADWLGMAWAIGLVAGLTAISSLLAHLNLNKA